MFVLIMQMHDQMHQIMIKAFARVQKLSYIIAFVHSTYIMLSAATFYAMGVDLNKMM